MGVNHQGIDRGHGVTPRTLALVAAPTAFLRASAVGAKTASALAPDSSLIEDTYPDTYPGGKTVKKEITVKKKRDRSGGQGRP